MKGAGPLKVMLALDHTWNSEVARDWVHRLAEYGPLDLTAAFADVASYSKTVLPESDHAELMTLSCKHAQVGRNVAHLVLPDEVQVLPARDGVSPSGPVGRVADAVPACRQ